MSVLDDISDRDSHWPAGRFVPRAGITAPSADVRFTPKSDRNADLAINRHFCACCVKNAIRLVK